MSRRARRHAGKKWLKPLLFWLIAIAVTLSVAFVIRADLFQTVQIAGSSMENTLMHGDIVLVTKFDYADEGPGRGDVVLCRFPDRAGEYVKRVIGLPGETVEIVAGQTYIDGVPISEPYVRGIADDYPARTLVAGEYLVLGDNRPVSYDSREEDIGSLTSGNFLGRVRCVLWPLDRLFKGID